MFVEKASCPTWIICRMKWCKIKGLAYVSIEGGKTVAYPTRGSIKRYTPTCVSLEGGMALGFTKFRGVL
ncbi:hypothetical protein ACN42_g8365 [Penicillium freii]|uniref:Uncharacterized protein n=1 Tax=Penicillium freii TaxID=48697 RepID=A0A101MDV3_PENFR|nr:hypothetical protein ACN42_g8365 [Penicillium freii]